VLNLLEGLVIVFDVLSRVEVEDLHQVLAPPPSQLITMLILNVIVVAFDAIYRSVLLLLYA